VFDDAHFGDTLSISIHQFGLIFSFPRTNQWDIQCLEPIRRLSWDFKGRASACSEMLRLAADPKEDDGVRDLIRDLFMKLWLENGEERVEQDAAISPASL
jgi:hypothetical protein